MAATQGPDDIAPKMDNHSSKSVANSASDLEMAPVVGAFSLVENGARPPHMTPLVAAHANVHVEDGSHGSGWAAAVRRALG